MWFTGQPLFVLLIFLFHTANGWMLKHQGHTFLKQQDTFRGQGCTFQVAAHVNMNGFETSKEGMVDSSQQHVIFQGREVMVVETTPKDGVRQRYLVFHVSDGSCHEQAEQACSVPEGDTNGTSVALDKGGSCPICVVPAAAPPPLNYIRSMLGGGISALANMKIMSSADRFLAIGLGSGALPLWAARNFPGVTVEAVDLSEDVVAAAPCFGIQNDTLALHVADGRSFLDHQPEGTYDVIFIDAFDDRRTIPQCLGTLEFFEMVGRKLKPEGGVMALNVAGGSDVQDLLASIQPSFMHISVGSARDESNHVILASQMQIDPSGHTQSDTDASQTLAAWVRESKFVAVERVSSTASHDADILGGCAS